MDKGTNEWKAFVTRANQLVRATIHPAAMQLPVEGAISLEGATGLQLPVPEET